ncbi:MAG: protein kinase domain-containing protein [Myxococcota bacterium]
MQGFSHARPGEVIAGKYRVDAVLGEGGMGVVLAAFHLQLEERVALKFLRAEIANQPEAIARFLREARAAVRIKNDHVARVLDVGALDGGPPYIVMEYLDGINLSSELSRRGSLPTEEAVDFVLQACEALAEAHVHGIVHRDLKPANLFITRRADGSPWIKVLDFGISKIVGRVGEFTATQTAAVMGSPLYMSPEQIRASREVDARTDIWSIGVILYELLTGRAPFQGQTLPDVSVKIAVEPPTPIAQLRAGIPAPLEAVIQKCLEKDRERRFRHVGELATDLCRFGTRRARASAEHIVAVMQAAQGASLQPVELPRAEPGGAVASTRTAASWGSTSAPKSRKHLRLLLAAGAAAGALGVLVLAGLALRTRTAVEPNATNATAASVVPEPLPSANVREVAATPNPSSEPSVSAPSVSEPTIALSPPPSASAARAPVPKLSRPTPITTPKPAAPKAATTDNVFDTRVFPKSDPRNKPR